MKWCASVLCNNNDYGDSCTSCGVELAYVRPCHWIDVVRAHVCDPCYEALRALEALRA